MGVTEAAKAWRGKGQSHRHRGHAVFYVDERGDGEGTLVCVHGFPTSSFDWWRVWDALRARYARIVAPDLLGFGWSDKPRNYVYSIFDQADLVEGVMGALGIGAHELLAHDYGDTVAQELLARHDLRRESRLRALCFLNGGLFPETHRARRIQTLLAGPLGPLVSALSTQRAFDASMRAIFAQPPSQEELDVLWSIVAHQRGQHVFHRLIGYMQERRDHRSRWVGAMQRTRVPLRVVDGLDDPISGAHMLARYRDVVPDADCVELRGVGHYPQLEDPAGVIAALDGLRGRAR
jgi:pimeloyl-ACP methyl ester carboxylesterase